MSPDAGRMRALIVDDEPPAVERLGAMLAELASCEVVGCESRAARVLERCASLAPDVILLDIEMPGIDGIRLAGELKRLDKPPAVVFTTAHEQYAVDAFAVDAVDYLVKPVRRERLMQALSRIASRRGDDAGTLAARVGERRIRLPLERIRAVTAEDKCTVAYTADGSALVDDTLRTLEQRYADRFVRVHRSALVSRGHLRALFTDSEEVARVEIQGLDFQPEVSRRNLTAVKRILKR
ncbi:MAG: response regulator transcription factor [Wenzhouxiangellaceae bacterium]|nr:response regulator transcription factor [Wenzhouxiangellaceae bacterium]